jgi:predicted nucleic acid-binding protein
VKIVVNAGPLIALGKLGVVNLLQQVYGKVLIPSPVYREVVVHGLELGQPDAYEVQMAVSRREMAMVVVNEMEIADDIRSLAIGLGEKAAIHLARLENADWLLLDDQLARQEGQRLGLRVKGSLGVLVEAYKQCLLNQAERDVMFDALLQREDIWISSELIKIVWEKLRQGDS